jgi:hypothetical protein
VAVAEAEAEAEAKEADHQKDRESAKKGAAVLHRGLGTAQW